MPTFIETPRFPECVAYGASGGPKFMTNVVALASGREQRNIVWSEVRAEYDVAHAARTSDEMAQLRDYFYAMRGKAYGFRFKDYNDFECLVTAGILNVEATSPLTATLYKRYSAGAMTYDRRIYKPVSGTVTCYRNGVEMSGWTVDYTSGIVSGLDVGSPQYDPGDTLTWAGQFDVPVRFDIDHMNVAIQNLNAYTWGTIKLVELRFG